MHVVYVVLDLENWLQDSQNAWHKTCLEGKKVFFDKYS